MRRRLQDEESRYKQYTGRQIGEGSEDNGGKKRLVGSGKGHSAVSHVCKNGVSTALFG